MKKAMSWILILVLLAGLTGCGGKEVTALNVDIQTVTFTFAGETVGLRVEKVPADGEGSIAFESSNESVATVSRPS